MKILWLSSLSCYGNVHAFLNYPYIEKFLKDFEFIYHPTIEGKYTLNQIVSDDIDCDILIVDGTLEEGLKKADVDIFKTIRRYGKKVKKIITVGTCASFGGIFVDEYENRHGLHFKSFELHDRFEEFKNKTITLSGCPVLPDILVNTIYSIKKEYELKLDKYLRPKEYYAYTIHNGCTRNEYFEYKVDNHEFGNIEGCMYYDHGCQAPFSNGSCNKILWNETSSKTRVGHPCMGCTEPDFPRDNLFSTKKNMGIPAKLPLGIAKRTYLTIAGVTKAFKIDRLETKLVD
jgi:hydrogenase small subunit